MSNNKFNEWEIITRETKVRVSFASLYFFNQFSVESILEISLVPIIGTPRIENNPQINNSKYGPVAPVILIPYNGLAKLRFNAV